MNTVLLVMLAAAAVQAVPTALAPAKKSYETIYVAMCRDKPDGLKLRYGPNGVIGAHLDYIDTIKDRIAVGGPSNEIKDGKPAVHGSVIAYRTANLDEAKALLAADPLAVAFENCAWDSVSAYVGTYVGGWAGPYKRSTPSK